MMVVIVSTITMIRPLVWFLFDDSISHQTKCAARAEVVKSKYVPYQPATICVNTDQNKVNADGYPCSYLSILHDNENIAYDCETQADTSEFTASNMCCACGGGETWVPGTVPSVY